MDIMGSGYSANGASAAGIVITGSGSLDSMQAFAGKLEKSSLPVRLLMAWEDFYVSIVDPDMQFRNQVPDLYVILLAFEDWDHFSDHIRDPRIEPSYGLVRRKTNEVIECLAIAATRTQSRLAVVIEWSQEAFNCGHVNAFFEEMASSVEEALGAFDQIAILYQGPAAKSDRRSIKEALKLTC